MYTISAIAIAFKFAAGWQCKSDIVSEVAINVVWQAIFPKASLFN